MAISEKMAEARFNTPSQKIFSHKIWCLAGDGCMQEGISAEAAAIAGVMKLGNLVLMYDSNDVTRRVIIAHVMYWHSFADSPLFFRSGVEKTDFSRTIGYRKTLHSCTFSLLLYHQIAHQKDGLSQ